MTTAPPDPRHGSSQERWLWVCCLDPDMESPRGCKPAPIRLPTALDGYARRGSGERDHRVDPTGAVATRTAAGGRSGVDLGRRRTRICTRRYVEPRPIGGPAPGLRPPPSGRAIRGATR